MKKGLQFRLRSPQIQLSENDVERACLDLLQLHHYLVLRLQSGLFKTPDDRWVRLGAKGLPDYAALHQVHPGFLLEVKRPGGSLSPDQQLKIREIQLGYHLAIVVVDSVEGLIQWLKQHERN